MSKEDFRKYWLSGWKIGKIAKETRLTEKEALAQFSKHFKEYIAGMM